MRLQDERNVISAHCGHLSREESVTLREGSYAVHVEMMYVRTDPADAVLFTYATAQPPDTSILAALRAYCTPTD